MLNREDLIKLINDENKRNEDIILYHINHGVIFESFKDIVIGDNVVIGEGTRINSNNVLQGKTVIGANCRLDRGNKLVNAVIGGNVSVKDSAITDSKVGSNTTVGPFANIHTNAVVGRDCRVGNFVEIKNSTVGINTKIAHLAYVGDVDIGNKCNIGCGAIFVNYDGKNKHRSYVGDSVFIGSNCNIIAPVKLEDNAFIAAGTTVTIDLPKNCMCIGRNRETVKENASRYRKCDFEKKYFGTDGIRGIYGELITEDLAYLCGNFLGYSADGGTVVIGRDTRVSGKSLVDAMIKGITDAGCNVINLDITTTPSVAYVTAYTASNYGIVITASHNPSQYNGIKIFNYDGRKLANIEELEIEEHIDKKQPILRECKGRAINGEQFISAYVKNIENIIGDLSGLNIVLDCSNGASVGIAKQIFHNLNCEYNMIKCNTSGVDINDGCGALYPNVCAEYVVRNGCDIGYAYDGDADRIVAIDEKGKIVNGDEIIYVIAKYLKANNRLIGDKVVGTIMTNYGVEKSLSKHSISMERTDVGDHYVIERMLRENIVVGGERSGHIILREFSNTGDGVLVSLFLSKIIKETGKKLSELVDCIEYPVSNKEIITKNKKEIINGISVKEFISQIKNLNPDGRIIVRASGTEPKIRITSEYNSQAQSDQITNELYQFIIDNTNI